MTAAHSSSRSGSAPAVIDTGKASNARVCDTALGDKDDDPADREVVDELRQVAPETEQFRAP